MPARPCCDSCELPSKEVANLLPQPPRRDAAGRRGENRVVARQRAQPLGQFLLRGDAVRAQDAPDLFMALVLADFFAEGPHAEIQEPTPLSVNSSPMMEWGTRPSSRCTLGTPLASTFKMLFVFATMP